MFPESYMQVLASANWPHVLADTRTTGKCHRCQRRFTVTADRSAFPWLLGKCNGKISPWRNGKKKKKRKWFQTLFWWLVGGLEITALLKEAPYCMCCDYWSPEVPPQQTMAGPYEGKSWGKRLISAARAQCHKSVISTSSLSTHMWTAWTRVHQSQKVNEMMMLQSEKTDAPFVTHTHVCAA